MNAVSAEASVYDAAQFDDNFPEGIERHYWFMARNDMLHRALAGAILRGALPANPRILEVGCGPGVVVEGLRARGHDVWGCELGRPPRSLAPNVIWQGTRAQDLDPSFRASVDVLLCLDVIEHVPDDRAFLRDTLAAFPQARAIAVTVPGRPEVWSDHDRHYGHFRRYTRRSLRRTLADAGLVPTGVRYVFRSLYLAAALMKLSGRQRRPVMTVPGPGPLHRAIAGLLTFEDRMLAALPLPGLSVLGIGMTRRA